MKWDANIWISPMHPAQAQHYGKAEAAHTKPDTIVNTAPWPYTSVQQQHTQVQTWKWKRNKTPNELNKLNKLIPMFAPFRSLI